MATPSQTKIHLNLDSLEREDVAGIKERREPFRVIFHDKEITFADPAELPYRLVMMMDSTPDRFFKATLNAEDHKHFSRYANELTGFKLRGLTQAYRDHYGLDEMGNVAGS